MNLAKIIAPTLSILVYYFFSPMISWARISASKINWQIAVKQHIISALTLF